MDLSIILGPNVVQGYACFRNGECHELLGELIPGWVHQLHGYIPTSIAAWIITSYIVYHIYMTITHSGVRYRNGVDDTNKTARIQDILASLQRQFYTHEAREKATENHKKPGPQLYGAAPLTRAPPSEYVAPVVQNVASVGRCNPHLLPKLPLPKSAPSISHSMSGKKPKREWLRSWRRRRGPIKWFRFQCIQFSTISVNNVFTVSLNETLERRLWQCFGILPQFSLMKALV